MTYLTRADRDGQASPLYDVAIVGFGPSGALAANLLGQAGLKTLCVDRLREVYDKPRAIALDHEIKRLFDNIGIADDIAPYLAPFDLSEHFGVDGQLLRRVGMVGEPYPLGYTPTMVFTQPPVETVLRNRAEARETVDVRLGEEVIYLRQQPDLVSLGLRSVDTGSIETMTARYVIGCDGASSTIRALAGLTLTDLDFDEPWIVADFIVNEASMHKLPANSAHFCEPERPIVIINGPGRHRRWEIMLNESENPREMERSENVWSLVRRWLSPDDATLWRAAAYRFHALVAKDWQNGRVFIAGDAAHQQPPILGQGMCQGMRDVANLCWRIEAVLGGRASLAIFDSYGRERGRHVAELIQRIKTVGEVLCERDPERARARDDRILSESGGMPRLVTRQSIIPPLEEGFLWGDGAGRGELFPQPSVAAPGDGFELMDKVVGTGWRLVLKVSGDQMPDLSALLDDARDLGATPCILAATPGTAPVAGEAARTLVEANSVLSDWMAARGCEAVLVRPDHYVFATSERAGAAEMLRHLKLMLGAPRLRSETAAAPAYIPIERTQI